MVRSTRERTVRPAWGSGRLVSNDTSSLQCSGLVTPPLECLRRQALLLIPQRGHRIDAQGTGGRYETRG